MKMNLSCPKCGTKMKKYKTKQHEQIARSLNYMGIPAEDHKYVCPKCYPE